MQLNYSQIGLILVVVFVIYCVFYWKFDNFQNQEPFEIYDQLSVDAPIYSKKCCGNN